MEKKTKIIIGLLILLVLVASIPLLMMGGVVMWQLGVFSPESSSPSSGASSYAQSVGFVKIKPLSPRDIDVTADAFSCVFVNAAGATVEVTGASQTFSSPAGATPCAKWEVELPGGQTTELNSGNKVSVGQGNTFVLKGSGCNVPAGAYSMALSISYEVEVAGFTQERQETGTITGT